MVNSYYIDSKEAVSKKTLWSLGVLVHRVVDLKHREKDEKYQQLISLRHFKLHDTIDSRKIENAEAQFDEHLHDTDEIRLFLEGSGYFDVRDLHDRWIRIELSAGDLIFLVAGLFHRFNSDSHKFFVFERMFVDVPNWQRHYRKDTEKNRQSTRDKYLAKYAHTQLTAYYMTNDGTKLEEKPTWDRISKLGFEHFVLNADLADKDADLIEIRAERGYNYIDYIDSTKMPNLKERLVTFNEEHLHDDEEIRFFINGSGYFDIRDPLHKDEPWIRIECRKGDMLVLPAGIYHRFVPDSNLFFHVMRLFQGEPRWTPYNRVDPSTQQRTSRSIYETSFVHTDSVLGKRQNEDANNNGDNKASKQH